MPVIQTVSSCLTSHHDECSGYHRDQSGNFLLDVHAHVYGSMSIFCYDDLHVESLDISNDSMACDL